MAGRLTFYDVRPVTVVPPGGGDVIGDSPIRRVEILSDRAPVHATVARLAAGHEGADLHVHYEHSDLFYALAGEVTVRLGLEDRQVAVPAGALARVPPGVVHGFRNAGEVELRYLNFHAPGCDFATYMRGLRDGVKVAYDQHDPPADGGRPLAEVAVTSDVRVLTDVDAIRVERLAGVTEPLTFHALTSYWVLEGDLKLTAAAEEIYAPEGSWVQIPPGRQHVVDGVFLRVTAPSSTG
jgi:mannose-6-phosphate isomerase-like protein (cupin superfamily)